MHVIPDTRMFKNVVLTLIDNRMFKNLVLSTLNMDTSGKRKGNNTRNPFRVLRLDYELTVGDDLGTIHLPLHLSR